jgi:acetyl esterase/lipase
VNARSSGLLLLTFSLATRPTVWSAGGPPQTAATFDVEVIKDIAYFDGKGADPVRHKLDLYLPKGKKEFSVLVFVHGGGWKNGSKDEFEFLGKALAKHGIGVVTVNYRLFPEVKFPANVEDVARAVAWTHKHAAKYGGQAGQLFLGGHSAGGHLVSLLATDASYLKAYGLALDDIRGVISISGLYNIPRGRFPLFEDSDEGVKKASPLRQIQGPHPPFLLIYADKDFPSFGDMAEEFAGALQRLKLDAQCLKIAERTHGSVMTKIAEDGDPVGRAIVEFIEQKIHRKARVQ